jgi:hypothetical protein
MLFVYIICFHTIFIFRMRQYKQTEPDYSFNLDDSMEFMLLPTYSIYIMLFILCHRMEGCRNVSIPYGFISHIGV